MFKELIDLLNAQIKENNERAAKINASIDGEKDEKVLAERKAEIEEIAKRNKDLASKRDDLIKKMNDIAERSFTESKKIAPAGNPVETLEERNKKFKDAIRTRSAVIEARSLLSDKAPFAVGAEGINGVHTAAPSLVDYVDVQTRLGENNERIGYDTGDTELSEHASGAAITVSDLTGGYVELPAYDVATIIKVDRKVWDNPNTDVQAYVEAKLQQAFRKTAGKLIANGVDGKFFGIANAVDSAKDSMVSVGTQAKIDAQTLRSIVIKTTGNQDEVPGAGLLLLNKADLAKFADVRGTNEKKAVYEFKPDENDTNTGILSDGGIAVRYILVSSIPENTMYYGKGLGYRLNLYSNMRIEASTEAFFSTDEVAVKGVTSVGGNVQDKFAWSKITIGAGA